MRTLIAHIFFLMMVPFAIAQPAPLEKLMISIRKDYSDIAHMPADDLAKKLAMRSDILLLDVREKAEYDVSRLDGALRVDPGIWTGTFIKNFRKQAKGKTVVFYCSVGVRSSRLASRVKDRLLKAGAREVYNLEGGIFHWHGSKLRLVNDKGQTGFVHPYDSHWGKLVKRRELLRIRLEQ